MLYYIDQLIHPYQENQMRNITFSQFIRNYRKQIAIYLATLAALILFRNSQLIQAFDNVTLLIAFGTTIWAGSKLYLAIPRRQWNRAFDAFCRYCDGLLAENDETTQQLFAPAAIPAKRV